LTRVLWARRLIVAVALFSCVLGGLYVLATAPRIYIARARVILDLVKLDEDSGRVMSKDFAEPYVASQLYFLKDVDVTGRVVQQFGWLDDPLVIERFNQVAGAGETDALAWMARGVSSATSARLLPDSNVMEIEYRSTSPEAARQIVDAIRNAYVEASIQRRRNVATDQGAWYEAQAVQLRGQIAKLGAIRDRLQKETGIYFSNNDVDLDTEQLRRLARSAPLPVTVRPPTATPMANTLARLDQTIAQQSAVLGPNHPTIQALRRRKALLEAQVTAEQQTSQAAVAQAVVASQRLVASIDLQREKITGQASSVAELRQVQDQLAVMGDLYRQMVGRSVAQEQKSQVTESELVPVGEAEADPKPYFPNPALIMGGTTGLGLVLGTTLALFVELLSRRVRGVRDLASATLGPVLGTVSMRGKRSPRPRRAKKVAKPRGAAGTAAAPDPLAAP
jgi:uncharacterized protein involved in exopolysaccharide biosynthesis